MHTISGPPHHADSHIKCLVHLFARNVAALLDKTKYRRNHPGSRVDQSVARIGEDPG